MQRKFIALAFLFLAILPALSFAATFDRTFTHPYGGWQNAYVRTDIETSPSLSLPLGKTVYCVGDTFAPTLSVQSDWYSSVYDAQLANQNNFGGCLVASCTPHTNNGINWVTNSQYQTLSSPVWYTTVTAFNQMISNNSIPNNMPGQCSKYLKSTDYQPYNVGGNTLFKSDDGAYCKGTLSLVSSNSAYSRTIAQEYTGSIPAINPPIVLNTASPSVTFTTKLDTSGCIISGRTYATSACYESVYLYYNLSGGFPFSAQNTPVPITVKNPFNCSLLQFASPVFQPGTILQGQAMPFSFNVTNPATNGEDAKIISVNTSGWSPSPPSPPQPNGIILPYTVPRNGLPYNVSGFLNAPNLPGTYTFNLVVNYSSSGADCSGSVVNCQKILPVTILVSPPSDPVSCTLAFENHGAIFTPADSAWVNATCRNSLNSVVPCNTLSWTTTALSGSMSPQATNGIPSRSLLAIAGVSAPQANANVKAQGSTGFSCTIPLNVNGPDYTSFINAYPWKYVNEQFTAYVQTKNIGGAANRSTITRLRFNNGAPVDFGISPLGKMGTMDNSTAFNCPPQPGNYTLNSTADATFQLNEGNESNNNYNKTIECRTSAPADKPDYVSNVVAPISATYGSTFNIQMVTANTGSAGATVPSTTQLNITGYAPKLFNVPALAAGAYITNLTTATCPNATVTLTLKSFADLYNQTGETNRSNNNDTATVNCVPPAPPGNRPNYIPKITVPPVVFLNLSFTASFTTKNNGTASATADSVTRAIFQAATSNFPVGALSINGEQTNYKNYTCTIPVGAIFNETVDVYNDINESDENNTETKPIVCYQIPTSCILMFVNHNSTFHTGESAPVQAQCFAGGLQTACPPFFWQQSSTYGSMNPANTNASWTPNSTLSIFGTVTTQLNQKVNATSTLAGTPLGQIHCELGFNVSDYSPIGPDYVIMSIAPDPSAAELYEQVDFTVVVKNIGNVDAVNDSTGVAAFSSGCEPVGATWYGLPHLDVNETDTSNDLSCKCIEIGTQNITVTANPPPPEQEETDYDNNAFTQSFICQGEPPPITCDYFV